MRLSYGSARFLNLISSGPSLKMRTIYTMFGERCIFDCAYCTQAKTSHSSEEMLSRITWPEFEMGKVVNAIERSDGLRRICLQVVSSPSINKEAFDFVEKISKFDIPISASVRIPNLKEAQNWFDHGIERLGMATDIVDEMAYESYRGGKLQRHVELIQKVSKAFPGRVTTHVIVGLGESERQMVEFIQKMYDSKISVGLFAFTPVKGTKLENNPKPPFDSYRHIQMAHYLLKKGLSRVENFDFSRDGKIISYGFDTVTIPVSAFGTSGCPNCTRPYYNESPGKEPYNFFEVSE